MEKQSFRDDDAVSSTNNDASECKRSAVKLGYYEDPFIGLFLKQNLDSEPGWRKERMPEINRGYYARVKGIDNFIQKFLKKTGDNCQIINLGCGFDTLYWRLKASGHNIKNFIELDFPTITARKCYQIKRNKVLLEKIHAEDGEVRYSPTDLHSNNYHIVGVDLRNIDEVAIKMKNSDVNFTIPTIFLAECVLVYIEVQNCSNLLKWFTSNFQCAAFINYEQVSMNDRFGEVMLSNLRARGCSLAGVECCISLETQIQRFVNCGFHGARSWDMVQIYDSIPTHERQRIERLEMLDEGELLTQLFQHYSITIAWLGDLFKEVEITVEKQLSTLNID